MFRRRVLAGSVGLLAAYALTTFFLTGCEPSVGEEASPQSVSHQVRVDSQSTVPSEVAEVLRYPVSYCGTPDPTVDAQWFGFAVANEIHAGLTRLLAYPEVGFEMDLSDSYTVGESGLRYTFHLRPGLEFADGSPVTAHDVVWSWNRAARKARHGSSAHTVFDAVLGFTEVAGASDAEMSGVNAVDDSTLVVDLARPVAHFPMLLANPVAAVLSRDNALYWDDAWSNSGVEQAIWFDADSMPTGAGPFKLVEFDADGDGCVLESNARYWDESVDVIERIELIPSGPDISDADFSSDDVNTDADILLVRPRYDASEPVDVLFENGEVDVLAPLFKLGDDLGDDAIPVQLESAEFLILSPLIPPLDNLDFRLALLYSGPEFKFDGNAVSRVLPHSLAAGKSISGRVELDADAASDNLRRCECVDEVEVTLRFNSNIITNGPGLLPFQVVFKSWKDVLGIKVSEWFEAPHVELLDFATGNLALRTITVDPSYPHPSAVLDQVLSEIPGLEVKVPELKALSDEAASEGDAVRSARLYLQLEQAILDSGLVIPLMTFGIRYARVKPWVHGLGPVWPGASFFRDVRVTARP